jgi:hypothetical protein
MLKKFQDFCKEQINESLCVDGIPVDNTLLSLMKKLLDEGKSEYVIRSYFYSIGVPLDRVNYAYNYLCNASYDNR